MQMEAGGAPQGQGQMKGERPHGRGAREPGGQGLASRICFDPLAVNVSEWKPSAITRRSALALLDQGHVMLFSHRNCRAMRAPLELTEFLPRAFLQTKQKRISRFRFLKDAKCSLAGRLMIRHLVRTVMGIPDSRAVFRRSQKGKPFLSNSEVCPVARLRGMQFNVSHHGDWVILAAESRFAVGCDVMPNERPRGSPLAGVFPIHEDKF